MIKKITIIILILLALGGFFVISFWYGIKLPKDVNATEEKIFSVEKGQGFSQIAENLEKEGLIRNSSHFKIYALLEGYATSLQAGEYILSSSMPLPEIVQKIVSGDTASITVTIPEGFTVKQIEERLGFSLPGENLEGFLFPDTYHFPANVSGQEVVDRMTENFDRKLTEELREEIKRQGKTVFEIITMASLIEKEVRSLEDKKLVSGVLWKRLEINMPLQVDATIAYITGRRTVRISLQELQIDSPYNTYKYRGLPVGPICNPGLESIIAAIYPQDNEYWYYLSTPESETIFSRTLEEHNIAKAKYLR